jgi:hypothetical protein
MKVYQYNEMMRYLTRKPTPVTSPEMLDTSGEQRETFAEGSKPKLNSIEKQNLIKEKETSILNKLNNQLGMGPAALTDIGSEVINDVKGLYGKYAPQVAKGALTGLKVIGTPAVSAGLYAQDVYSDLKNAAKEGSVTASKALNTLVGQGEKGLFFMLPELAKDVVTNPIASKILQLGSIGRFATPFGAGLSAAGVAKDFYNQYKEFEALPQEQKELLRKQFTYDQSPEQTTAIENMGRDGAATGGRIGYANESEDELEIPTINSEEEFFGKSVRTLPKEGGRGLYFGIKEIPKEIPRSEDEVPIEISGSTIKELKQYLASKIPEQRPEIGYRDENFGFSASRGFGPFANKGNMYEASYTPNQDVGTFSINKGPGYIGAGYGREDLGNFSISKTPFTTEAGYNYDKDNLSYGIQALVDKMGNKEAQARLKYKFAKGGKIVKKK